MSKFRRQRVLHGDESEDEEQDQSQTRKLQTPKKQTEEQEEAEGSDLSGSEQSFVPDEDDAEDGEDRYLSEEEEEEEGEEVEHKGASVTTAVDQKLPPSSPQQQQPASASTATTVGGRGGRRGGGGGGYRGGRGGEGGERGERGGRSKRNGRGAGRGQLDAAADSTGQEQLGNRRQQSRRSRQKLAAESGATIDGATEGGDAAALNNEKKPRRRRRDRTERRGPPPNAVPVPSKILARVPPTDTATATAAPVANNVSAAAQLPISDSMTIPFIAKETALVAETAPLLDLGGLAQQEVKGVRKSWADIDDEKPRRRRDRTRKPPRSVTAGDFEAAANGQEQPAQFIQPTGEEQQKFVGRRPESERKGGKRRLVKTYVPKFDPTVTVVAQQPVATRAAMAPPAQPHTTEAPITNQTSAEDRVFPTTATTLAALPPSATPSSVLAPAIESTFSPKGRPSRTATAQQQGSKLPRPRPESRGRSRRDQYQGPVQPKLGVQPSTTQAQLRPSAEQTTPATVAPASPSAAVTAPKKVLRYSERHKALSSEAEKAPPAPSLALEPKPEHPHSAKKAAAQTTQPAPPVSGGFGEEIAASENSDPQQYYDFFVPPLIHPGTSAGVPVGIVPPHMQAYQPAASFGPQMPMHLPLMPQPSAMPGVSAPFFDMNQGVAVPPAFSYHQTPQQQFLRQKLNANARTFVPGMGFGDTNYHPPSSPNSIHSRPNKQLLIVDPTTGQPIDLPVKSSSPVIPASSDRENVPISS